MRGLAGFRVRTILVALFALATAMAGSPHRSAAPDPELAAYVLPDGTVPEICGGHAQRPAVAGAGCCLDCLLLGPPVPATGAGGALGRATIRADVPAPTDAPHTRGWQPAAARAPPIAFA